MPAVPRDGPNRIVNCVSQLAVLTCAQIIVASSMVHVRGSTRFDMDSHRFDQLARRLASVFTATQRRTLLQGAAALGAALTGASVWSDETESRKKRKRRKRKNKKRLCRKNGTTCNKKSKKCKANHCLNTPFTIEALWTNVITDHDTFVFVPNEAGVTLPSPWITSSCNPASSNCELDLYPFICVSEDAQGPGDEVTTVRQLIPGTYEYWVELYTPSPAADLTVTLRRSNGKVVQSWSSPENGEGNPESGWHVFNIDGQTKSITSIDQLIDDILPDGAHTPNTNVCPM
jgi:hypothetical protein